MKSPFEATGPKQAEFTVFRTSSFLHAENIARELALCADLQKTFPAAVVVRSRTGPHEVRVSYGIDIGGQRMLESLVSLKATVAQVIAGAPENPAVIQSRSDVLAQLPPQVFGGLIPAVPSVAAAAHA